MTGVQTCALPILTEKNPKGYSKFQNKLLNYLNNSQNSPEQKKVLLDKIIFCIRSDGADKINRLYDRRCFERLFPSVAGAPDRLNLSCLEDTDKGHLLSYHMTVRRAMKEIPTRARPAIIEELTNLTKKGVLTGRHWVDLTPTQRDRKSVV